MTRSHRIEVLFLLTWSARMAMGPMAVHWCAIGAALVAGTPTSWAAGFTLFFTATIGIGCAILVVTLRRHPAVQARMRGGTGSMLRFSFLVLLAAAASNIGGTVLLIRGETACAVWAMGLGTFVMLCEIAALIGSAFSGEAEPLPETDP